MDCIDSVFIYLIYTQHMAKKNLNKRISYRLGENICIYLVPHRLVFKTEEHSKSTMQNQWKYEYKLITSPQKINGREISTWKFVQNH